MTATMVLVSSCFSLQRKISEKKLYSLELKTNFTATAPANPELLLVKEFDMAPMYTSSSFVYRRGEFQFDTDYYNEFITPPQRMITAAIKQALFDAKLFYPVPAGTPADCRLYGRVVRLYGDFRQADQPMAVMEISITLDKMGIKGLASSDTRTFSKEINIKEKTPEALAGGWNLLLEKIIKEFIKQIQIES